MNGLSARVNSLTARRKPELVVAGRATDEAGPWLERISKPPFQDAVRYIGYVDPAERRALYEGARLLILPSFEEGFGFPVLRSHDARRSSRSRQRGALQSCFGDAGVLVEPRTPIRLLQR